MIYTQYMPKTPTRTITAKVELYQGSTLLNTFNYNDCLKSIDIDRTCEESKLFGMCVSQKAVIKIMEVTESFVITDAHNVKVYFDNGQGYISPFPTFYINEVKRDKVTKEVTITAFDLLKTADNHTVAELGLGSYTVYEFAAACTSLLGATGISLVNLTELDSTLKLSYEQGANFDGTETIRQALTALAEVTQTIIYFDYNNNLVLKRYQNAYPVDTVTTSEYFTFETKERYRINKIAHITELGDNVEADGGTMANATTVYLRDNPFLELREDVQGILDNAVIIMKKYAFTCFDLNTRGNYLIEIGDLLSVMSAEGGTAGVYLLNDSIKYSGGLSQKIFLNFAEGAQTHTNPTTLGETLKATSAKVDKVNRQIELLASEENINASKIAALEIHTDSIAAKVESVEKASANLDGTVADLTKRVDATMSAEDIKLEIKTELQNGTAKVETATGYTFNEDGLTVSKSGSEMTTTITEDGMTVKKDGGAVLTANNEGVTAIDLHATTFLIIGTNSRFENYSNNRTACFWIGGSN